MISFSQTKQLFTLSRLESLSSKCAKLHTMTASNNRDHLTRSLCYCLFVAHIYIYISGSYSSHTSQLWWIAHSMQHQQRGCNNTNSKIYSM